MEFGHAGSAKRLHPEIERCHITLHVLGDIGFEPGAAGVAVDAALDDVVGSVGGDGSHGKQEDDSGGRRKDAERGHGRRINVSSPLDAGEKGWEPFIWWERGEEGSETSLVFAMGRWRPFYNLGGRKVWLDDRGSRK